MKKMYKITTLFFLTFILTGCVKYNTTIDIKKDKSMDFSIVCAVDSKYVKNDYSKILDSESKTKLEKDGFEINQYNIDGMIGYTLNKSFKNIDNISSKNDSNIVLSNLNDLSDNKMFSIKKGFIKNIYSANFKILDSSINYPDDKLNDIMDISFKVRLPYSALNSNANKINDNGKELIWNYDNKDISSIAFEFELYNRKNIICLIVTSIVIILLIIFIIIYINKRKINKRIEEDKLSKIMETKEISREEILPTIIEEEVISETINNDIDIL